MKRIRAIAAAATAALILIAGAGPAVDAYGTYSKWGTLSVGFYVNPANADVSDSAATSAVQSAMNVWNTQAGTGFRYSYNGQVNDTTTGYDSKNVLLFRNQSSGSTIASTYSWTSGGVLVDSDIVVWDGGFQFFTGTSGCTAGAYIEDIATHELGHALGLVHSADAAATMYPTYTTCSTDLRTLSSDDISGIQSLYGSSGSVTDTAPTVTIVTPQNGSGVPQGTAMTFSGSATDAPDGDISGGLVWRSNIDGQIGTGASFSRALSAGSHTITATSTDAAGHTSQKSVSVNVTTANTAPSLTISSPSSGTSVAQGTALTFNATATDTQDGTITPLIIWSSSIDGTIGSGSGFSRTLSVGSHVLTANVSDSGGLSTSKQVSVTVTSTSTNTAPTVSISSPSSGTSVAQGTPLTFTATATDAQDGNVTVLIIWSSSIDGTIGSGSGFSRTLSAGSHVLTARITDSGGLSSTSQVSVTVTSSAAPPPPPPPAPPSSGPTLNAKGYKVKGSQQVDLNWNNLTASSVDVYRNGGKVMTAGSNGSSGSTTDKLNQKGAGSYTYKVCAAGSSTTCSNQVSVSF